MITNENIPAVRIGLATLQGDSKANLELARRLIENSAWWYLPQGNRRARNYADRIRTGRNGLELALGGNRFLVGQAISKCATKLDSILRVIEAAPNASESGVAPYELKRFFVE